MAPHSCVLDRYKLVLSQQPLRAGTCQGADFLDLIPICHLRPRDPATLSPDPILYSAILYCTLELAHPQANDASVFDPLAALFGPTAVGPNFERGNDGASIIGGCRFVFRDLRMRAMEGLYHLRFTLFETIEGRTVGCGSVRSNPFRVYERGTFSIDPQALVQQGINPRVTRPPMIRKRYQPQRSTLNYHGLPEHPGLATAIYRPEPRSQMRISHGNSRTGSERTTGTQERRPVGSRHAFTGQRDSRRRVSSSLPTLSDGFNRQDDELLDPTASHQLPSPFIQYHPDATSTAIGHPNDPYRPGPSTISTPNRLSKKQSAPAGLDTNIRASARPITNPGHQVGASRREYRSSHERGPVLPALIRRQLSRQSSPASVSMVSGAGSSGSRAIPPVSAFDPFRPARPARGAVSSDPVKPRISPPSQSMNPMHNNNDSLRESDSSGISSRDTHGQGRGRMGIDHLVS